MKVLIIGPCLESLFFCEKFLELDAGSVTFWSDLNPKELVEKKTESLLFQGDSTYWKNCLQKLSKNIFYRNEKILRIQKTYFSHDEERRMRDTFKVVYEKTHEDKNMETFENYDIVLNFHDQYSSPLFLGGIAPCVQEPKWQNLKHLNYGKDCLGLKDIKGKVVVVGKSFSEISLFEELPEELIFINRDVPSNISNFYENKFEKEVSSFEENKVVGKRGVEPVRKFHAFKNVYITNVDFLEDREQVFLTLERPSYIGEELLKTIAADKVLVLNGFSSESQIKTYLREDEPGYYLVNSLDSYTQEIEELEKKWLNIKNDFLQFFSKA